MKFSILIFHWLLFISLNSFAQVNRAPSQNFNNAGGATGTITSGIPTHFSSVGQPTVLARPASTNAGGGVMTANELMFSVIIVVDSSPPTFGTNGTNTSVAPGNALAITADFVDAESNVTEAVVQYKSVSALGNAPPDIQLTKVTGNNWTGSIPATSIGELGVEYKFKIKNGAPLEATSPLNKVVINHTGGVTIAINTTFSKSQSNYRIIANPLVLSPNTIDAIFSEALGGYDENVWRMYRYENSSISKLSKSSTMDIGKGYWFISTKPPANNIFTTGAGTTVPVSVDEPFEITLSPGWNQIGNPYNFNISWNDVRAANSTIADKLSTKARSYDGNVKEIDEIKKFEGAYVSNTGAVIVKIKIPVAKNPIINGRIKSKEIENPLSNDHWEVKFNLSNGLQRYTLGGVGMHPQANESVDAYDDFNIPRFFEYLEVKHPKQLYDMSYTKDVVPTQQEHTWNFSTESNQEGENITLAWDNSYFGNGGEQLWLMDVEAGAVWDMRKENKVVVAYSPIRKWRVAFGSEAYVKDVTLPEQNSLIAVYPNPFTSDISIEVAVVETSVVKLDILDLNGKNVRTLVNQQMNKGRYITKWEGTNIGSDDIAVGVYIVRFQAGAVVQFKRIVKH